MTRPVVVITGAGSGIGLAVAIHMMQSERWSGNYAFVYQVRSRTKELSSWIENYSQVCRTIQADLTQSDQFEAFRTGAEDFGEIVGVVNCAGSSHSAAAWKDAEPLHLMNSNFLTTAKVCKAFAPGMRERGRGSIVNVSSIVAHRPSFGASAYAASKGAVEAYTRALALELAPKGIRANCVALGYFNTGIIADVPEAARAAVIAQTPLGRLGEPGEAAEAIAFLLGDRSSFVTGTTMHVNGGLYV